MDVKELQNYRRNLYLNVYDNKIPDRVPVQDGISTEYQILYTGRDLRITQYEYSDEILMDMFEKTVQGVLRGDRFSAGFPRNAIALMLTGERVNIMGASGYIQHPETSFMSEDEYDEFIAAPFDFMLDKISTRKNSQYEKGPVFRARANLMKFYASQDQNAMFARCAAQIIDKYGFDSEPAGSSAVGQPPFDMIADTFRGFSSIPRDLRRCPEKVHAAMDAMMPYLLLMEKPSKPHILGSAKVMTHMAAFLNTKQFEEFYYPQFKEMVHINAERGAHMLLFLEQDWTRFIDHLCDMPMGTRFYMEQGDLKQFKEKMGKKYVLGGGGELGYLKAHTKEECIDKVKSVLDVMAPGGNYYFCWDKSALTLNDIDVENYTATMEYVRDHSKYDNPGAQVSDMKREDTIVTGYADKYPELTSKYAMTWDEFKLEYPPVAPEVEPAMKAAYEKYLKRVLMNREC